MSRQCLLENPNVPPDTWIGMQDLISRYISGWIPLELRREACEDLRRARLTVCVAALHVAASLSWAVVEALMGSAERAGWSLVSAIAGAGVALMIRQPGLVTAACRTQVALVLAVLGSASILGVGLAGSEAYILMGTIPILATALLGCREGVYWTMASIGVVTLWTLFEPDATARVAELGASGTRIRWVAAVGLGGMVLLLSTLLETLRSTAVEELADANAELVAAQEVAAAAHEVKMRFLTNMSHEFRTPMNSVISTTDLLTRSELPLELRDLSATACQGALSLLSLFHQMLCATLDGAEQEAERVPCDLPDIVYGVARSFGSRSGNTEDPWLMIVDYNREAPKCFLGDPLRIRQVLLNLVGNAIKFTESGYIRIGVRPAVVPGRVRIEVEDTGIGVPEEQQDAIFQRFTQADTSTTRRYGGAGLGLAISRDLVHGMGGSIGVRSVVGRGSTFWFELPCDGSYTPAVASAPADAEPLLVVEPHTVACAALEEQLAVLGLRALCPASLEDALSLANGSPEGSIHSAVIVSHDPPRIDGVAWLEQRRQRDIPAIVLSTKACTLDDASREALGITSWLLAPVSAQFLAQSIPVLRPQRDDGELTLSGLRGLRVLLVEDFVPNQKVARHILSRLGCLADIAANGLEALEYLCKHEYDVVLMDCQMPEMDGYEATRRFRVVEEQQGRKRRMPIIAVTANALPHDRKQCIEAGMDDYVPKPISLETLRDALLRNA